MELFRELTEEEDIADLELFTYDDLGTRLAAIFPAKDS